MKRARVRTRMDFDAGGPGVISWQNRRKRSASPKLGPIGTVMTVLALLGVAVVAGQMIGWLHWRGPLAFAPAALVLILANAPIIAAVRAAFGWLGGSS